MRVQDHEAPGRQVSTRETDGRLSRRCRRRREDGSRKTALPARFAMLNERLGHQQGQGWRGGYVASASHRIRAGLDPRGVGCWN